MYKFMIGDLVRSRWSNRKIEGKIIDQWAGPAQEPYYEVEWFEYGDFNIQSEDNLILVERR